jgi:probable HAF family extracellular repeat protein
MRLRLWIGLLATVLAFAAFPGSAEATTYYQAVTANGINSNGYWDIFLNPQGQISSVNCGAECDGPRGEVWSEATTTSTDVGPAVFGCFFEDCFYTATSINGSNRVSGWIQSFTASCGGADQAYVANIATDTYSLMRCNSEGYFVNAAGQLVGGYRNASGSERAFLWDGSTFKDLGTLGGVQAFATGSSATNQVIGCSQTRAGVWHPFLYKNGTMTDLGLPAGVTRGCAYSINANGLVLAGDGVTAPTNYGGGYGECHLWTRSATGTFATIKPPAGETCFFGEKVDLNGVVALTGNHSYVWKAGHLTKISGANIPFDNLSDVLGTGEAASLTGVSASNLHGQLAATVDGVTGDVEVIALLTPLKIYNDNSTAIIYSPGGNQSELSVSGAWANDLHYWSSAGYTASLKFTGKSVRLVGEVGPNLGTASVALDGANQGSVSETQSITAQRQTIFQHTWATSGTHTIKITVGAGDGPFTLDAIATTSY